MITNNTKDFFITIDIEFTKTDFVCIQLVFLKDQKSFQKN